MEQEKDVSEYLQEVNFLELNNNSLWQRVEEAFAQQHDIKYVVDMGTDLVNGDSCASEAGEGGVKPDSFDLFFYVQCFRMLEFSFNNDVVRHPVMQKLFAASIEILEQHINEAMTTLKGTYDESTMREKLPLDSIPFLLAKRMRMNFNDVAKDNDIRLSFQALLLFLLRRKIPPKYTTEEAFLQKYPEFSDRSPSERTRLRNTANWMVLTFHTIQPRNNKSFMMHLIPKLIEGKNARYITGSGQTKATADRVHLFRTEGECEKIQRPPRKRKDPSSSDLLGVPTSEFAIGTNVAGAAFNGNNLGNNSVLPNLTPNLSVPAIDPLAFQLHLQLLQQQQLLHPRNNNGPVPNTNAMMLSNQIYSALLMQQQATFAHNNTNAASNNINSNALVSNYAALYAAALQKASLNLANSSAAVTSANMNSNNKRNYQNHSTLQQFQHVSQDSLSSADGLSSGAPSPTYLAKKKNAKHSNNVSVQNKLLQSFPLATSSSSMPISTASTSAPNATAASSGLSHQPNLFLHRSASVNDIPQVSSSSLFLSDEAMLSSTEAPILKRAKTAHNLDFSGKNAANSHAASFRASLASFYPPQTLPVVTSTHPLLSTNPLTHSNGMNSNNLFVNPSLYHSPPLSATTSSQSLSSTLSSPFLSSLSIGQQPSVLGGTNMNDLSAIKLSLFENNNNTANIFPLNNNRLSMMQQTHDNSNSSMGLDALLSAAECLEEYPSIA